MIHAQDSYVVSDKEEYMNPEQLMYFERKLMNWRKELLENARLLKKEIRQSELKQPDLFDAASSRHDLTLDLKEHGRQREFIKKIDKALNLIENGEYGFCELTGNEIGLKRLEAMPVATLCVEAQEMLEKNIRGVVSGGGVSHSLF